MNNTGGEAANTMTFIKNPFLDQSINQRDI